GDLSIEAGVVYLVLAEGESLPGRENQQPQEDRDKKAARSRVHQVPPRSVGEEDPRFHLLLAGDDAEHIGLDMLEHVEERRQRVVPLAVHGGVLGELVVIEESPVPSPEEIDVEHHLESLAIGVAGPADPLAGEGTDDVLGDKAGAIAYLVLQATGKDHIRAVLTGHVLP